MLISSDQLHDLSVAGAKAIPAASVSVATLSGINFPLWINLGALLWIGLQAAHLTWKWRNEAADRKRKLANGTE